MSYRIEYDSRLGKYEVRNRQAGKIPVWIGCILTAALLLIPQSRAALRSLLIPGADEVTAAAFQTMANDLKSGAGISEAFFDFCSMVIHGS